MFAQVFSANDVTGMRLSYCSGLKRTLALLVTLLLLATVSPASNAAPLQKGNLLISTRNVLYEVTTDGMRLQSFVIPGPGARSITESARDIVMDSRGRVHVYNGTFHPFLSTYDPVLDTWQHRTIPGWSTVNNVSYGGIGAVGDYVFLTDMRTGGGGAKGVIRYDFSTSSYTRFATNTEPIDLTVGLDGRLYVLHPGGSPGGRTIDVYDPLSLSFMGRISLSGIFGHTEHRSIAVDADASLFVADWDSDLQRIDFNGPVGGNTFSVDRLNATAVGNDLYDVDVSLDGVVAVGSRFGQYYITDENLFAPEEFRIGSGGIFVSFVTVPEPSSGAMLSVLAAVLLPRRRKKSQ